MRNSLPTAVPENHDLSNLAEGWAEAGSFENNLGGCPDRHLLWHRELRECPDDDGQRRLSFAVGDGSKTPGE